jgi:hypothetical protein
VANESTAKDQPVPVNQLETISSCSLVPSATASGSDQSCFDTYDSSCDDKEYSTPNNVAETTPGRSDRAAHLFTTARLYMNAPPGASMNWGRINPNLNEYRSDPIGINITFWIPDIMIRGA